MNSVSSASLQTDAVPISPQEASSAFPKSNNDSYSKIPPMSPPSPPNIGAACPPGSAINFNNCSNIHLGNTVVFKAKKTFVQGINDEMEKPAAKREIEKDSSVLQLMNCSDTLSTKYMIFVSENLGKGWRNIFRNMGYTDGFIETMIESHKHEGISEVIYQILLDWTRNAENDEQKSVAELSVFLWNEKKYELVQELASLHNTVKSKNIS